MAFFWKAAHRRAVFTVKCSPFITRPLVTSPRWMKSLTELQEDKPAFRGINQVHQRQSFWALGGHAGLASSAASGSNAGQLPSWQLADSPPSFILRVHQRQASKIKHWGWGVENEASHHCLDECSMTSSLTYSARVGMVEGTKGPLGGDSFRCVATWNSVFLTCHFPVVNKIMIMIIIHLPLHSALTFSSLAVKCASSVVFQPVCLCNLPYVMVCRSVQK